VTPLTIPILRVAGSHRDVGHQIGEIGRDDIRETVDASFADIPSGRSRDEQLALAARFRAFTEPRLPWLIEELDGCAEAAGVDPLAFFATTMEEIWYAPYPKRTTGRCSDLVAGPRATAAGHLIVGHNNDLGPEVESVIVAIEKTVTGDPVIFQIGGAPLISVGWNSAGISLTGNELSPNDERLGLSRSHQVFEILRARSMDEALAAALRPDRASSYNNVLTSAGGGVANVEGSATDAEVTGTDAGDHLVHTNHYICDRMLGFEGDVEYAKRSHIRYERGRELLAAEAPGSITPSRMRDLLSDHETKPDSLCRHPEFGYEGEKTVFWCVADVTEGRIEFGRGNPCDSEAQAYRFANYG
jgi:hypothetical protein